MDIILVGIIIIGVLTLLFLINFAFLFITLMITPAGVWLKAKIMRRPLICMHFKDGIKTRFVAANKTLGNFAMVKGFGYYELAKDTASFDQKGKLIWYNVLTENAKSQQLYKAALVQELKELGYKLESWHDLKKVIDVATNQTDKSILTQEYDRLLKQSKEKAEKFKLIIKNISRGTIDLVFNKSYKFAVLYNLFSNDYNPSQINEAIHIALMEDRRKRNVNIFAIVIIISVLLIVAAIAFTIIKSSTGPTEVVLQVAPGMIKNGTTLVG